MQEIWVSKLTETIENKLKNGGFKRGELSKLFISLAEEFKLESPEKPKNYYYRVLKKEIEAGEQQEKTPKPKKQKEIATETNNLLKLTYYQTYPADNIGINAYTSSDDSTKEWLDFTQVDRNIAGKTFKEYINTINNGELIISAILDGKQIEVIEKETLLKKLPLFSSYTHHLNASRQAEILAYLLKASEQKLEEKRSEKFYDSLKFGEIVKVKIAKLMSYGAMVNLVEYPHISGMIHISEIKKGYVDDISLYFKEEQIVEAKLLQKKDGMRLNLSTKDFKVPLLNGVEEPLVQKSLTEHISNYVIPTEETNQSAAVAVLEKPKVEKEEELQSELNFPDEWKEVSEYVKSFVGPLSPEAKSKLKELIQEFGLFKFSLGINDATKEFKNDLGLILLSKAETKLRDGL